MPGLLLCTKIKSTVFDVYVFSMKPHEVKDKTMVSTDSKMSRGLTPRTATVSADFNLLKNTAVTPSVLQVTDSNYD